MKTTLFKKMGWLVLLMFLNQAFTQPQNQLLTSTLLVEPVVTKNTVIGNENTIVPLQSNMRKYVDAYLKENAYTFNRLKARNSDKWTTIQNILVKQGLPAGLVYLAIVESELNNKCTSGAGAAGIWQLMPETARTLGLQVNSKTDQRRHTYKSSVAAAEYFKTLYSQFDDWLLVVAAYNCGAGGVYKAIKLSGSREFWKLQRFLPAETRNHVKRFIATHFYYEQNGSMVTLTKKERLQYLSLLNAAVAKETTGNTPVYCMQPAVILDTPHQCEFIFETTKQL